MVAMVAEHWSRLHNHATLALKGSLLLICAAACRVCCLVQVQVLRGIPLARLGSRSLRQHHWELLLSARAPWGSAKPHANMASAAEHWEGRRYVCSDTSGIHLALSSFRVSSNMSFRSPRPLVVSDPSAFAVAHTRGGALLARFATLTLTHCCPYFPVGSGFSGLLHNTMQHYNATRQFNPVPAAKLAKATRTLSTCTAPHRTPSSTQSTRAAQ